MCNISAPPKRTGVSGGKLAFRKRVLCVSGAGKARSASDRPHEAAAQAAANGGAEQLLDMYLRQIALTGGIPFKVSLPQAPETINADLMTTAEIHTRLQEGFEDIEAGRVQDAKAAFAAFRESHR